MQTPLVSVKELQVLLAAGHAVVVDCRFTLTEPDAGRLAWTKSRIPGAVYAHLDNDLAGPVTSQSGRHPLPDAERFMAWLGAQGITPQTPVVVYDAAGGAIAARLWWLLRFMGHTRVAVLNGGWQAWTAVAATDTGEPGAPQPTAAYNGTPGSMPILPLQAVESAVDNGLCLLDARDPRRFAGEVEPIDPVKGHVPGAINLPFNRLLGNNGGFLPPANLAEIFAAAGADSGASADCACMCGSGVTACHLILAADSAGLPTPALFVGSWSEWIRDTARSVAKDA